MNKILFGKDKNGGFKEWRISVFGDVIAISHGKEGGKMQTKTEVIQGKNIGRSNETSPEQQAILEAESRYKKRLDKGYRENKADLEELEILPMLASDYRKQGHRIKFPCYAQPKLDGARCLAIRHKDRVELRSRGGKEYSVANIQKELMGVMLEGDVWDGEIYQHSLPLEHIISAIKKPNENTQSLEFVVFDCVLDAPYEDRLIELQRIRRYVLDPLGKVSVLPFTECENEDHLNELHDKYVAEGYEGIMVKNFKGLYESGKRSADVQKMKKFFDDEFQIVAVHEDRNENAVLEVYDPLANANFTVCFGSFEERKYQLTHPDEFIGKWLTVQYQTRYAETNLLQFPTGKGLRDCNREGGPLL